MLLLLLSGCETVQEQPDPVVSVKAYERVLPETVTAELTTIDPTVSVQLVDESNHSEIPSCPYDGIQVEKIFVTTGTSVKEGDVLLKFSTVEMEKEMKERQEKIDQERLLYEHYQNLKEIENTKAYDSVLLQIQRSMQVDGMYLEEIRAKMEMYQIRAQGDGIVRNVICHEKDILKRGSSLFNIIYSDGIYTTVTEKPLPLQIGGVYEANEWYYYCEMELVSVEETEDGQWKYTFHPVQETGYQNHDFLHLDLYMGEAKKVILLPDRCLLKGIDDLLFVYVLDEDGYLQRREVTVSDYIGTDPIISSGVEPGDKVVLR